MSDYFHPLVSIVIPVYNGANYMREAIDSALSQTYDNIEIIVVNDGSTDDTEVIAKSYGDKIRYFKKENGGVASALNLGIKEMKGDYFSWLSHDDVYYPNKIQDQILFLFQSSSASDIILFSDVDYINERSEITGKPRISAELIKKKPEYAILRSAINGITLLIPKSAFEEHGLFNERLYCAQDYSKWFEMMRSYQFVFFSCVVGQYRLHSEQDTKKNPRAVTEGDELWIQMLRKLSPERMTYLEGGEYEFYCEMELYLQKTPYRNAKRYCHEMATKRKDRPVLLLISHSSQIGGAELCLYEMVNALQKTNKYYCFVILPSSGPLVDKLNSIGVHTSIHPMRWWVMGKDEQVHHVKKSVFLEAHDIIPFIKIITPALICTNTSVINIGALLASAMGIPHLWNIHEIGEKPFEFRYYLSGRKRYVYIDKSSDYVLFNSNFTSSWYKRYSSFCRSSVITPGIDTNTLAPIGDHKYFKRNHSFKIVVVGSILRGKRQGDVIQAVKRMKDEGVDVELVVAGGSADEAYAREIGDVVQKETLHENVTLVGFVQRPSEIVRQADVVVVCSENESFGRVAVEAMYMRKPIVGAASGGTKDIIRDGETGLLYPVGDVKALTSALLYCKQNPQICKEMGEKGLMRANELYAESVFITSINGVVENILRERTHHKFVAFIDFWIFQFYIRLKGCIFTFYTNNLKQHVPQRVFLIKNKILNTIKRLNDLINMFFIVLKRDGLRRALLRSLDVVRSLSGPSVNADRIFAEDENLRKKIIENGKKYRS